MTADGDVWSSNHGIQSVSAISVPHIFDPTQQLAHVCKIQTVNFWSERGGVHDTFLRPGPMKTLQNIECDMQNQVISVYLR